MRQFKFFDVQPMINWIYTNSRRGRLRRVIGESDAIAREDTMTDFRELWRKFLCDQMPAYEPLAWDSVLGAVNVFDGTFDLCATIRFAVDAQVASVGLCIAGLRDRIQGLHERDFLQECRIAESAYTAMLMEAWERLSGEPCVRESMGGRMIPFRAITDPDGDDLPLVERELVAANTDSTSI